ncbi:MAG: sulfotransferase domain-containing protein [Chloroflexi bacterium]|nr:sulfotransferase domain-containing protein [Chloroflexota bacterium]
MGGIVWLASYPKSGNTWLRVFLTNYLHDKDDPADINDLDGGPIASARDIFDRVIGVEASDLFPEEIDRFRPAVYEQLAAEIDKPYFMKVHDAWRRNAGGVPLFPATTTAVVIYLIRNPLDVAPSFAHHQNDSIDKVIADMANEEETLARFDGERLARQLHQRLFSWSSHVRSWVDESGLPVHVVRYEDMSQTPEETFTGIVRTAGLPVEPERVREAIALSRFDRLQAQEAEEGFKERRPEAKSFFRKGKIGSWREDLTPDQVHRLIEDHRAVMRRFGYLTAADEPVY